MSERNNFGNFVYAAANTVELPKSKSGTPDSVDITADLRAEAKIFRTKANVTYYILRKDVAVGLTSVTFSAHLATIALNFDCSLPIALLLWLFCGYFRTPKGYERMLHAASTGKGKIRSEIDKIIAEKTNDGKEPPSSPPQPSPQLNQIQNLSLPTPTQSSTLNTNHSNSFSPQPPPSSIPVIQPNPPLPFSTPQDSIFGNSDTFSQKYQASTFLPHLPSVPSHQNIQQQNSSNLAFPSMSWNNAPQQTIIGRKLTEHVGEFQPQATKISRSQPTLSTDNVMISNGFNALSQNEAASWNCGPFNNLSFSEHAAIQPITAKEILAMIGQQVNIHSTKEIIAYKLDDYSDKISVQNGTIFPSLIYFTCDKNHRQAYASYNKQNATSTPLAPGTYLIPCQGNNQYRKFQVGRFGRIKNFVPILPSSSFQQIQPQNTALYIKPIFYHGGSLEIEENANAISCYVSDNRATFRSEKMTNPSSNPILPGHYIIMTTPTRDTPSVATNQYISVGQDGQIIAPSSPDLPLMEKDFPLKYRRIQSIHITDPIASDFYAGWPLVFMHNLDAQLENIPIGAIDRSVLLDNNHFKNVPSKGTLSNLQVISLTRDSNNPQYSHIDISRDGNSIIARLHDQHQTPLTPGNYLFPIWFDDKHRYYGFVKFTVKANGVIAEEVPEPSRSLIKSMDLRTKASLVQMAQRSINTKSYVIGFSMVKTDPGFSVSTQPTHIYLRLNENGNVYAYQDSDNQQPLAAGEYSIPGDNTHYRITVKPNGYIEIYKLLTSSFIANKLITNPSGTYNIAPMTSNKNIPATSDKTSWSYCDNSVISITIGNGGHARYNESSLTPLNGSYVVVNGDYTIKGWLNIDNNIITPPRPRTISSSSIVESNKLPNSTANVSPITSSHSPANPDLQQKLLKGELYQDIKANKNNLVPTTAQLVGPYSMIKITFTLNANDNVQATPLTEGAYQINYKEQIYQIQVGKDGFLVETYTLSSDRTYKPLPLPNSNSFYIAELDQNGRYNSNNQFRCSYSTASSLIERLDKIAPLNKGDYVVLYPDGPETGYYLRLGTTNSSLAENIQKLLLKSDPLASSNNNQPNFIGESYPADQSNNVQLDLNSVALLADSTHFQSMPPNTNTQRITAITSTQSAERVPIHFAKNNQGSMFVFIGNDDKTVAPPGVYNIPLQGKNAYIQIEVGAYGWLISTSIREQLRISYQSGQTFDIANVPHFNTVGYDDRNASSLWISTIEQGKYTDQWSLVWPKRDNAGNLYFEYVGSNANMKFLAPGTYMCPMSNKQLFQILIGSSSGYAITYHGINAGDTYFNTQLDYDGLVKGNLIYDDNIHLTPPLDCTNGDRCYDANNIVPYSIDSSGTIHAGEATLTQGDYLVICPLDKYKIRGWVRVAQDGKIAELSPQPQTSSIPPPQVKILDSNPQISPPSPPPQVDLSQENPIPSPQTQNTPPQIPPSPSEQNTL